MGKSLINVYLYTFIHNVLFLVISEMLTHLFFFLKISMPGTPSLSHLLQYSMCPFLLLTYPLLALTVSCLVCIVHLSHASLAAGSLHQSRRSEPDSSSSGFYHVILNSVLLPTAYQIKSELSLKSFEIWLQPIFRISLFSYPFPMSPLVFHPCDVLLF